MTWVTLPIETDEGPLTRAQQWVMQLAEGETCTVRTVFGDETEGIWDDRGFWRGDDGQPLDVVAVLVPERSDRHRTDRPRLTVRLRDSAQLQNYTQRATSMGLDLNSWIILALEDAVTRKA